MRLKAINYNIGQRTISFQNSSPYSPSNGIQQMQQASQNLSVSNTEDIVTTSQKPKKGRYHKLL